MAYYGNSDNSHNNFFLFPFLEFLLRYSKAPMAATRASPKPMCLSTITQVGRKHKTQSISLVNANVLHTVLQMQTEGHKEKFQTVFPFINWNQ